ncbi:MAG: DUF4249 family protein [Tannerellaceae bacterium]|nr:DUF4249 family protein [Tannerellaceae bacterium]
MKKFLFYIFSLFLICCYGSCTYDSIIKIDQVSPKGVLNAILHSDTILMISVSQTGSGVDTEVGFWTEDYMDHYFINHAEADVFVNGQYAGRMERGNEKGIYVLADYVPEENDLVSLEVETPYGLLSGEVRIPALTPILSVDTQRVVNSLSESGFLIFPSIWK